MESRKLTQAKKVNNLGLNSMLIGNNQPGHETNLHSC